RAGAAAPWRGRQRDPRQRDALARIARPAGQARGRAGELGAAARRARGRAQVGRPVGAGALHRPAVGAGGLKIPAMDPLEEQWWRELEFIGATASESELGTSRLPRDPNAGDELYVEWLGNKLAQLGAPSPLVATPAVVALRAKPDDRVVRQVYIDSLLAAGE